MNRVLIIRSSSLGDIVHALPVVHDMHAHCPDLAIDWVAEEPFAALVRLNHGVRRVVPVALRRWRHRLSARATWREAKAFRSELRHERYDAVIDLQEQVKGALIAWLAHGPVHGPDRASAHEALAALFYRHGHRIDAQQHLIVRCRQPRRGGIGLRTAGRAAVRSRPAAGRRGTGCAVRRVPARHQPGRKTLAGGALASAAGTLRQCRFGSRAALGQRHRSGAQRAPCRRRAGHHGAAVTRAAGALGVARLRAVGGRRRHGTDASRRGAQHADGGAVRCHRTAVQRRRAGQRPGARPGRPRRRARSGAGSRRGRRLLRARVAD